MTALYTTTPVKSKPRSPIYASTVKYKGMDAMRYLIRDSSSPVKMGRALIWALQARDEDAIAFLQTKCPDYDEAIAVAAQQANWRAVRWLADNGASRKGLGRALHWALRHNRQAVVGFLNDKEPDYDEAIAAAAKHCSVGAVVYLAQNGAGKTGVAWALAWAVRRGHRGMVAFLRENADPDYDVAIQIAARYCDVKAVGYLANNGAGVVGLRQALYWAVQRENNAMVALLKGKLAACKSS